MLLVALLNSLVKIYVKLLTIKRDSTNTTKKKLKEEDDQLLAAHLISFCDKRKEPHQGAQNAV